ncbi:MAG: carboxypeptidase regulatory-like domain-containing protein [Pyrinomonadaceae bacterium]
MQKISLMILTFFLSATVVFAQSTTGKIVGTVSAADGAVPGAAIVGTDNQTGKERTATATDDGTFEVPQLEFGTYTVKVTATGFKSFTATNVKIDAGREYPLKVLLEVGQVSETVTVTAGAEQINSSNGELSSTVSREQIRELPLNGRNPLALLNLTAGAGPTTDSINGQRSSSTTITRDGLNVQDNFIRSGTFVSDRPTVDDTGEFTVTTQNAGAEQGGGSSLVQLVTPRGGSKFHGNLFEFNRNSEFTANSFFNNANNVPKGFLNRNQFGGTISGPAPIFNFGEGGPSFLKNKAFFFFNYEGFRLAQDVAATGTTLLPQSRNGDFTYVNNAGQTVTANVLTGAGFVSPITAAQGGQLTVDPIIQARILNNLPTSANGITTGTNFLQVLNFNRKSPVTRNSFIGRFDVDVNDRNSLNFVYKYNTETNARSDIASGFATVPFVNQGGPTNFFVGAYRLTLSNNFSNEVRAGFQTSKPFFNESNVPTDYLISIPLVTNPEGSFRDQGRNTDYRNVQDNAVYTIGNHSLRFGGQIEFFNFKSLNAVGTTATYFISGTGNTNTPGLIANQFPGGINTTDLARANSLRYLLGGIVGSASRTANLIDPSTGFGFNPNTQLLDFKIYSTYFSDQWRIRPSFTVNLGLRYEYYTPLHSSQPNYLEPVIKNNDLVASILDPNGTLNLIGGNSGRAGTFTKPDRNNFGPNVSFAYSPRFEKGLFSKLVSGGTVIRGGFRVNYVNDEYVKSTSTLLAGNPGVGSFTTNAFLGSSLNLASALTPRNGFTAVPGLATPPTFTAPPITFAQNNANLGFGSQVFGVDPNLQVQRVLEYNVGIQRSIGFKTVLEIRYVGGRSNDLIRTTTFNQVDLRSNGFLSDFQKAQQNCRLQGATLAAAATAFDPLFVCTDARYNPAIAGSQPLTVFNNLAGGGLLNNTGTIIPLIQAGRAGSLAQTYITNRLTGTVPLVKNPNIFIDEILQNAGTFRYNALQAEVRRRFTNGFSLQANYTFQKTLTNVPDEGQNRQGELQDNGNPGLNIGRPDYDRTHTFNFNAIYELPFGKGKRYFTGGGLSDKIFGGFQIQTIVNLVSGPPLGIVDPRSTSTITFTSGRQSATSSLTTKQIKALTGTFRTPNGIYFIDPKVLFATATAPGQPTLTGIDLNKPLPAGYTLSSVRGASPLGTAPFPGQVFFFDQAGSTGNLPRNFINGLPYYNWDLGLSKNFHLTDTTRLQLRVEAFNVLNKQVPAYSADLDVSSSSFGRVTATNTSTNPSSPRIIQFAARFDF